MPALISLAADVLEDPAVRDSAVALIMDKIDTILCAHGPGPTKIDTCMDDRVMAAALGGLVPSISLPGPGHPHPSLQGHQLWPWARLSFCRRPLSVAIETPTIGRGGCSRMTISPTATVHVISSMSRLWWQSAS